MQYSCYHLVRTIDTTNTKTHTHTHTHLTQMHAIRQNIQKEREIGILTFREIGIIANFLDILIFTSKKTRSCSEFCLEGNTPWMLNYGHDAAIPCKHNLHDAEPVIRARVREKNITYTR